MEGKERLIGLYGPYCAGKDACAAILVKQGIRVIDVDALGHEVLADPEVVAELTRVFGPGILTPRGEIDRRSLGAIVFGNGTALSRLEAVSHPRLFSLVDKAIAASDGSWVCINAAILPKMPQAARCRFAIRVDAPFPIRLRRAMRRDGLGLMAAWARLRSQRGLLSQPLPPGVDMYSISNSKRLNALEREITAILKREAV